MKTKLTRKVVLIIATTLTALAMLTACDNEDISSYENTVKDTDTAKATSRVSPFSQIDGENAYFIKSYKEGAFDNVLYATSEKAAIIYIGEINNDNQVDGYGELYKVRSSEVITLEYRGFFKNGIVGGDGGSGTEYHPSGRPVYKGTYRYGKRDGQGEVYFDDEK